MEVICSAVTISLFSLSSWPYMSTQTLLAHPDSHFTKAKWLRVHTQTRAACSCADSLSLHNSVFVGLCNPFKMGI